jgi:hypothetical protein
VPKISLGKLFFLIQVLGIRDNEITVLKKSAWLMSIVAFIWTSVPFMVALASFATYVFMDEGNTLTAGKAFVTLSYLVDIFFLGSISPTFNQFHQHFTNSF